MVGELTPTEVSDFFSQHNFGHLGCNDGSKMYIVPVSYIYVQGYIFCHSRAGMKIDIMRKNPSVCFEVEEVKDYTHWKSIIAWGNYEEIIDEKEIESARRHFSDKSLNIKFSLSAKPPSDVPPDNRRIEKPSFTELVFYKIEITEVTGRYELGGFSLQVPLH